jgi:hypothetical protein
VLLFVGRERNRLSAIGGRAKADGPINLGVCRSKSQSESRHRGDRRAIAIRVAGSYMKDVRDFACLVAAREGTLHNTPNPDL